MNRSAFGRVIDDLHERGLEIGLAGSVIVNGINALDVRNDGTPLAPFLRSSLAYLSPAPPLVAYLLIIAGLAWLFVLLSDIGKPLYTIRVICTAAVGVVYVMITAATLTGMEPKTAPLRFMWSVLLLLVCFLATVRLRLAQKRGVI